MAWFKVDDKAHSNNKIRKVLAEDPAALALWTVAGSWSSDNTTDGFVPDHQLPWLVPSRSAEQAQVLVNARLWRRVRGGYQFHEWDFDSDGTKRNPTASELREMREKKAEAGRKGGINSGKSRSSGNEQKDSDLDEKDSANETKTKGRRARRDGARKESPETGTVTPDQDVDGSKAEARASADASARAEGLVEPPSHPTPAHTNTASNEAVPPPPPASGGAATRGTRLPDDFAVTPAMWAWAKPECPLVDIEAETKIFIDYWGSTGKNALKVNWTKAWQVWMRKEQKELAARAKPKPGNRLTGADSRNGPGATDWDNLPDNLLDF